jgi:hypothetical protein
MRETILTPRLGANQPGCEQGLCHNWSGEALLSSSSSVVLVELVAEGMEGRLCRAWVDNLWLQRGLSVRPVDVGGL